MIIVIFPIAHMIHNQAISSAGSPITHMML